MRKTNVLSWPVISDFYKSQGKSHSVYCLARVTSRWAHRPYNKCHGTSDALVFMLGLMLFSCKRCCYPRSKSPYVKVTEDRINIGKSILSANSDQSTSLFTRSYSLDTVRSTSVVFFCVQCRIVLILCGPGLKVFLLRFMDIATSSNALVPHGKRE